MVSVVLMGVGESYSVRLILNTTRRGKFVNLAILHVFARFQKQAKTAHIMEGVIISGSHTEL